MIITALTTALDVPLSQVLLEVSSLLAMEENLATVSSIAPDVSGVALSDAVSAA